MEAEVGNTCYLSHTCMVLRSMCYYGVLGWLLSTGRWWWWWTVSGPLACVVCAPRAGQGSRGWRRLIKQHWLAVPVYFGAEGKQASLRLVGEMNGHNTSTVQ